MLYARLNGVIEAFIRYGKGEGYCFVATHQEKSPYRHTLLFIGEPHGCVCRVADVQVTPKATSPPVDADGRNQEAERQRKEWREGLKAHIQQQRAGAQQVRDWLACCWGCREGCRAGQSR